MRNKKILLAVFCILSLVIGCTTAYFTHWMRLQNVLSVGENTIEIVEEFEPPKKLNVGDNYYTKGVRIKNTGSIPCYIRVFMEFSDSDIKDVSELSSDGKAYYEFDEYLNHLPEGWLYISEEKEPMLGGWFYYTKPVDPSSLTPYLLKRVKTSFSDTDFIKDYEIIVYSESVQVLDKNGQEFSGNDAYRQAWSEFTKHSENTPAS